MFQHYLRRGNFAYFAILFFTPAESTFQPFFLDMTALKLVVLYTELRFCDN